MTIDEFVTRKLDARLDELGIQYDRLSQIYEDGRSTCVISGENGKVTWLINDAPIMVLTLSFPTADPDWFGPVIEEQP